LFAAGMMVCLRPAISAVPSTPIEVFGRLPAVEDMILSPDGNKVAFVETNGDKRSILVFALDRRDKPLGVFRVGDTKVRSVSWLDDDNLLIIRSNTKFVGASKGELSALVTYRVSTNELQDMDFAQPRESVFNYLQGTPMLRDVGGAATLFVPGIYSQGGAILPALFRYSVTDRRMKMVIKSPDFGRGWLLDESGQPAAESMYRNDDRLWEISALKNGHMQVVASGKAELDPPAVVGFSANGDSLIVSFLENGEHIWKPLSLKDASWGAPLDKNSTYGRVVLDRKTSRIVGGLAAADKTFRFFDPEMQAHWEAARRAFPNEIVDLISRSDDSSKMLIRVFGAKDGYVYALFDWYTHRAAILAHVYLGFDKINEVRQITYPAADGLVIPAYLTLPNGVADKNLALIVLPHGGPAAQDTEHFDWWSQALAAQGYAVLRPNYRGSTQTQQMLEAGYGEWGRKMQTDLSDGVRYLANQGTVDPARVCIVGASYGGYAALAGVSMDKGVYRCGVSVAGPSDLRLFLKWGAVRAGSDDTYSQRYWDRFMGISDRSDPRLDAISPIEHASAVTVPLLLIHGRDDTVVPYNQSEVMLSALKRGHKPVEMVTLNHEDHWLSSSATRLQMLETSIAFLRTNNPPN
jgi:dienelactone hydrolase